MRIKHGQSSAILSFEERSTFEGRYGVDSANLLLFLDQYDKRSGVATDTWDDLTGYSISGQTNDMTQPTAAKQPSVNAGSNRDFDGVDNYMHQEIFDTDQGNMTFVADGGTAEFRDDAQDFSDWETTSGNATHMIVITTDNGVSWAYMGAANNSNLDIDCYDDIELTSRGWKARTTPQASPDTAASYEVLKTDFQITGALSAFTWVKPDDGQPGGAAHEVPISKHRIADGFRSWNIQFRDDGKIRINLSSDGSANNENEETDAAFFADGQETWHHIGFVYNGTTCVFYGDGVALDSTTDLGGIPAALHDVSTKLTIGALSTPASYFAGLIGPTVLASRAYNASEGLRLYHGDAKRLP